MAAQKSEVFFKILSRIADVASLFGVTLISISSMLLPTAAQAPTALIEQDLHNYCVEYAVYAAAKSDQPGALTILRITADCKDKAAQRGAIPRAGSRS
ncbi:hypothetical protein ACQR0Z_30240 [Bradyrhizobium sp. HKCCYLS3077]|uniref:hypothetical protein n=1 Tax=Bradyrhizobium sp. HKCCYLS3077 TaxID=3420761 RepID=UPI003EBF5FD8